MNYGNILECFIYHVNFVVQYFLLLSRNIITVLSLYDVFRNSQNLPLLLLCPKGTFILKSQSEVIFGAVTCWKGQGSGGRSVSLVPEYF